MAGPNPATSAADPIHQVTADPIYQAAVAASAGMSVSTVALPTHGEALMSPPPSQGAPVIALQPQEAEAVMGPPMTATQLLQAVEMIARLSLPIVPPPVERQSPDYDMPFGQQMTSCEQEMAEFNELSEMPSVDFYDRSLPSNASNILYVEGLPSNCTRRELTHLFLPFIGFREVRLVNGGFDNTNLIALVEFNTPVQAFLAMESLQGYLFDIHDLYSHSLHLYFSPGPRLGDGPSW